MELKCYGCGVFKTKEEYYKNNYNRCKECKRKETRESKISKNDVYDILSFLIEKTNSNETYIREIYNKLNNLEKIIMNHIMNDNVLRMDDTINNINLKNQKINEYLNDVIKYSKKTLYNEKDYEQELNDIMND